MASFAHRVRPAEVDRLVADAIARHMPAHAEALRQRGADGRHVTVEHTHVSHLGTSIVHGELDLADALDLETALAHGAATLAAAGSTESLDVRRSQALGEIARRQTTLNLAAGAEGEGPAARQTVLHVHLAPDSPFARLETRGRRIVTRTQVDHWIRATGTQVTIQPVIDLNEHIHVTAYEVPDRLAHQTQERDMTCVYPWCTRPARDCDTDHITPYADGGTTSTDNTAPLCRRHHRLKTHHPGWTYTTLDPGTYLWHTPHGYTYLRDHRGTTDISPDKPPDT